jgi:hypothetical protein
MMSSTRPVKEEKRMNPPRCQNSGKASGRISEAAEHIDFI